MMPFTGNQWAIVVLVLILGWLLGLLSRPGSGRWKRELAEQRRALEEERKRREAAEARINASNERIAELERQTAAHPIGAGTAGSVAAAARGGRDDLALIRGVGREGEIRLNDAGVHSYRDVEKLSDTEAATLEGRLGLEPGTIARQEWREQAALLREHKLDEHR
ncbi:MAG TPA: hypothetical protein VFL92_09675, partial [Sphingomonas sp.]|nr:hypothetical protein [Sphingomonas sp.]